MSWKIKVLKHLPKILLVISIVLVVAGIAEIAFAEDIIPHYHAGPTGTGWRYKLV